MGTNEKEIKKNRLWGLWTTVNDFESAIEYLEDFSSDDIILSSLALGCIGDAYMELSDTDNALSYYEDASSYSDNEFTTPRYMIKQAMIHESNGDFEYALDLYKEYLGDEANDLPGAAFNFPLLFKSIPIELHCSIIYKGENMKTILVLFSIVFFYFFA